MKIKILHLYYDLLNLYGEYGNINILKKHIEDQKVEVIVEKKTIGDEFNLQDYDFIYCGSGIASHLLVALEDFKKHKQELLDYISLHKYALFTGNSFEMLGKIIYTKNDDKEENIANGLEIFDFKVQRLNDCKTHDIIFSSDVFDKQIVGFINKQANIYDNASPLFRVEFGIGDNEDSKTEGVRKDNLFGTYVIGPLLVRNPYLLKFFVDGIISLKDNSFKFKEINYENEEEGYEVVLNELSARK